MASWSASAHAPALELRERLAALALGAQAVGQQRVVAELGVRVEGEVVGGQREIVAEERLEAGGETRVDPARGEVPEDPVVDEDELRPGLRRPLEELELARDAGGHRVEVRGPGNLEPVGAEIGPLRSLEARVEEADDIPECGGHEARRRYQRVCPAPRAWVC